MESTTNPLLQLLVVDDNDVHGDPTRTARKRKSLGGADSTPVLLHHAKAPANEQDDAMQELDDMLGMGTAVEIPIVMNTESSNHVGPQGETQQGVKPARWCAHRPPPTRACIPNGLVAGALLVVIFLAISALTEEIVFRIDSNKFQIVSVTMWSARTTEISGLQNSSTSSVESVLFPLCTAPSTPSGCSHAAMTLISLRAAAVAGTIFSFIACVAVTVDGIVCTIPRFMVTVPAVMLVIVTTVRWIMQQVLFHGLFGNMESLSDRQFMLTASLTVNVVCIIITPVCAVAYHCLYMPFHAHALLSQLQDEASGRHDESDEEGELRESGNGNRAVRDPLLMALGAGILIAV